MRNPPALLRFVSTLFHLVQDALRFLVLGVRSRIAVRAENLFLRKQLALFVDRKTKPRRQVLDFMNLSATPLTSGSWSGAF
jgi:hypothetical protein